MLGRSHPKVAEMLLDAQSDLLAFAAFPRRHWRQIWSTNPLERVNKEIKRRTDVVGVFPHAAALLRLAGSVLIEQHDEWEAGERRYFSEASMLELATMNNSIEPLDEAVILPELAAAWTKATAPHGVEKLHHSTGRDPEYASLIMTRNLPFARWGDAFGDLTIASAMIDRTVHHADVLNLKGTSYRMKNHQPVSSKAH